MTVAKNHKFDTATLRGLSMWSVHVDGHIENQETINEDCEARIRCIEKKRNWSNGAFSCIGALVSGGILLAVLKAAGVFNG